MDVLAHELVGIFTTLFGFEAVRRSVLSAMHNKVDVSIYQAKVTELHGQINSLRERLAVLEEREAQRGR